MDTKKVKCFVIMPFQEEFKKIYERAIKPAIETEGCDCIRVDEIDGGGNIIRHIVNSTDEANIVIADLTGDNPNVLYELGLAHGLFKHVIMLTQHIDKIPFDLKNYRFVKYDLEFDGAERLKNSIKNKLNTNITNCPIKDFSLILKSLN